MNGARFNEHRSTARQWMFSKFKEDVGKEVDSPVDGSRQHETCGCVKVERC